MHGKEGSGHETVFVVTVKMSGFTISVGHVVSFPDRWYGTRTFGNPPFSHVCTVLMIWEHG